MPNLLNQLIKLSQHLGKPAHDYAILGEGNTSAKIDDQTFWVKASGTHLGTVDKTGLVQVYFEPVLAMLNGPDLSDVEIRERLNAAKVDPTAPGHPSVETAFHASCLQLPDVSFVGHTHPVAINMISCSVGFETAFSKPLFPDEVVVCGPRPLLVPYVDPGLPLAREIHRRLYQFIDRHGERPKRIVLQNHGLIALAPTAQQVENITAMAVKAARILHGSYALGGPKFMTDADISRIHTRPDEHYLQKIIGKL